MNDSKPKGWFSRKHETRKAHDEAVAEYGTRADRKERRIKTATLNVVNQLRSPEQQIETLDKRLGKGKGAVKERAELAERLS